MLFRLVYGPELEAIFKYIQKQNQQQVFPDKEEIYSAFVPSLSKDQPLVSQNLEDALSFLSSAHLIVFENGWKIISQELSSVIPFQLHVLMQLSRISHGQLDKIHILDPVYWMMISELFVIPDKTFINNLHQEANRLNFIRSNGGITKEKVQSWKRVMEYLGVGVRVQNGFLCTYSPRLISQILTLWNKDSGTLQEFIDDHFSRFLPISTHSGEIAKSASTPLLWLQQQGQLELFPLQDSPTRFYFSDKKIRGIKLNRVLLCTN